MAKTYREYQKCLGKDQQKKERKENSRHLYKKRESSRRLPKGERQSMK